MIGCAILLAWAVGCAPTASVVWSPDGKRAAYGVLQLDGNPFRARWSVIDADGKPIAEVDARAAASAPWYAGFNPVAWSADSRSLYFAKPDGSDGGTTLCRWSDGTTKSVATLGSCDVSMLRAAPGGQWLAALCGPPKSWGDGPSNKPSAPPPVLRLVAIHLPDGALHDVTKAAGWGMCFTGPDRLAYIRADVDGDLRSTGTAQLVEDAISPAAAERADVPPSRADLLFAGTAILEPAPDGVLFLAAPRSFPVTPDDRNAADDIKLFHWTRATGRLSIVAGRVIAFQASPDGGRVLTVEMVNDKRVAVRVRRLDGAVPRTLRDLPEPVFSILPAWHGNDRITFQSAEGRERDEGNAKRTLFELVDIPVGPDGGPGPERTLSRGWDDDMRPAFLVGTFPKPTTGPATNSAVQSPR